MVEYDVDDALNIVDLVPGSNDELLPIAEYRRFLAGVMHSVGTGTIALFQIIGATDADGAGATIVVAKAPTTANAVGDYVWLECDAAQIREVLPTATHVGVRLQLGTAGDECVVFFERAEPFYPRADLTADFIS